MPVAKKPRVEPGADRFTWTDVSQFQPVEQTKRHLSQRLDRLGFDLDWTPEAHPRDEAGRFAEGGGGDGGGASRVSGTVPVQPELGRERPTPVHVKDIGEAVTRILNGEVVELEEVSAVHTVLEKLAGMARDAEKRGEKAPSYDLCNVSVGGSNLFCGSKLRTKEFPNGVPRVKMPQLSGKAVEGSAASRLTVVGGIVNASAAFVEHLKGVGISTSTESVPAAQLKATQAELVGSKVAAIMSQTRYDPAAEAIFVSRDNYVLDGHHRWAAVVGRDAKDGRLGDSKMNIVRVDAPISELLHRANRWTKEFGIKAESGPSVQKLRSWYTSKLAQLLDWDEGQHPRDESGQFAGGGASAGGRTERQGVDTGAGSRGGVAVSSPTAKPGPSDAERAAQGRPDANPVAQDVANSYNEAHSRPPVGHGYVEVNQPRARSIAGAYDAAPDDDSKNPEVRAAYGALSREVDAQWDHAVAGGMKFEPWTKEGQPYDTSKQMTEDVRANKHMYFYTGGDPHELMAKVDEKTGLTTNDKFRAVHDYYGHAAGGYGFGPRGEENAWVSHSQMLSGQARRALTTETRGQNSWVNFGRQNYDKDGNHLNKSPADRPYAKQKAMLLPDEFVLLPGEKSLKLYRDRPVAFSLTWDESLHPRGEGGRFGEGGTQPSEHAANPRVFNTPDDVEKYNSWGEDKWVWKEGGKPSGRLLTGEPIPHDQLPDELYHVTTNAPAVMGSGVLLGQRSDSGLGGGQADGVSFTTSKTDARVIQRELLRSVRIARGDDTIDDLPKYAAADEREGGLNPGALSKAVAYAQEGWDANKFIIEKTFKDGRWTNEPPPKAEADRIRRSVTKDALNAYLGMRQSEARDVDILKNPILFGNQDKLKLIDPANVSTLRVSSKNVPSKALVTTGSDKFLHEVRVYADVPSQHATVQQLSYRTRLALMLLDWDENLHPRGPGGRFGEGGGEDFISSPSEAYDALVVGDKATIAKEDLRGVLKRALKHGEITDLTNLKIEGTEVFRGGSNMPRGEMPQIPGDEQPRFLDMLAEKGVKIERGTVSPLTLSPTQNEINAVRVAGQLDKFESGKKDLRPILISKDDKVLDGHHRWAVGVVLQLERPSTKIPVIRIMADRKKALGLMQAYVEKHDVARRELTYREYLALLMDQDGAIGEAWAEEANIATALDKVSQFGTVKDSGGPVSIKSQDVFRRPVVAIKLPLNVKTTVNARRPVPLDQLEPTHEQIPVAGLKAYITKPRRDPSDVLHVVMRNGRERYLIQDGHTRLGAALLRGAQEFEARVWEFVQTAAGDFEPIPRGLHRRGMEKRNLSYRDKLALELEWDEGAHPRNPDGRFGTGSGASTRVRERQREPGEHFTSSHPGTWTAATHDTAMVYQQGGEYTADRQVLHKEIADRAIVHVQSVAEPVAYFIGGGPGSGKSTLIADGHIQLPDRTHAVHVSADDVKVALPEYGLAKHAGNSSAAVLVHEESSYLAKAIAMRGLAESKNVVVDNVGDSGYDKLASRIEKLRAAGATKIVASYVTISTEEAIKRADQRGQQTGRMVPHAIIREAHRDVTHTLSAAIERNLFDTVSVYDNTHAPKLIAKADKGVLTVHDRDAWDRFQKKAHQ